MDNVEKPVDNFIENKRSVDKIKSYTQFIHKHYKLMTIKNKAFKYSDNNLYCLDIKNGLFFVFARSFYIIK